MGNEKEAKFQYIKDEVKSMEMRKSENNSFKTCGCERKDRTKMIVGE